MGFALCLIRANRSLLAGISDANRQLLPPSSRSPHLYAVTQLTRAAVQRSSREISRQNFPWNSKRKGRRKKTSNHPARNVDFEKGAVFHCQARPSALAGQNPPQRGHVRISCVAHPLHASTTQRVEERRVLRTQARSGRVNGRNRAGGAGGKGRKRRDPVIWGATTRLQREETRDMLPKEEEGRAGLSERRSVQRTSRLALQQLLSLLTQGASEVTNTGF